MRLFAAAAAAITLTCHCRFFVSFFAFDCLRHCRFHCHAAMLAAIMHGDAARLAPLMRADF